MAISKIILNGVTQMDVTQDTVTADKLLSSYTATKNDGTKISGAYEPPVINTQSKSATPSETVQTILPDNGYYLSQVNVNAIPSAYIIPSGTLSISSNGTYDVASYESAEVSVSGGGIDVEDEIVMRTISGVYENNSISTIGVYAFYACYKLTEVHASNCSRISTYAFYSCTSLTNADFPSCQSIGGTAFFNCWNLKDINFPICSVVSSTAFCNCSDLTSITFPSCSTIGSSAFRSCAKLTSAVFPVCSHIGSYAFASCSSLTFVGFPVCSYIGATAFASCSSLTTANFPACKSIMNSAFQGCQRLTTISFPVCSSIASSVFMTCLRLLSAYFLGTSVPAVTNSNFFSSTPIAGYTDYTDGVLGSIFVKESMLTAFQTATNWSPYSARMVGLTDAEIEALSA